MEQQSTWVDCCQLEIKSEISCVFENIYVWLENKLKFNLILFENLNNKIYSFTTQNYLNLFSIMGKRETVRGVLQQHI